MIEIRLNQFNISVVALDSVLRSMPIYRAVQHREIEHIDTSILEAASHVSDVPTYGTCNLHTHPSWSILDGTALSRDAGKAKRSKGKAEEKLDEAVEAAEEAVEEALEEVAETIESADAESLELEKGTPQALALTLGKVAVVSDMAVGE